MILNKTIGWVLMMFMSFSAGCYDYAIVLRTTVEPKIADVVVSFDDYSSPEMIIFYGKSKTIMGVNEPIPKTALVKWKNKNGEYRFVPVDIKSKLPKEFEKDRDGIIFTIKEDDSVDVSFEIWVSKYKTKEVQGKR